MRIVGSLPHQKYKITLFHMNNRYSVKLEDGHLEQTYKFREGSIESIEQFKSLVSEVLLQPAIDTFEQMNRIHQEVHDHMGRSEGDEFPEII